MSTAGCLARCNGCGRIYDTTPALARKIRAEGCGTCLVKGVDVKRFMSPEETVVRQTRMFPYRPLAPMVVAFGDLPGRGFATSPPRRKG